MQDCVVVTGAGGMGMACARRLASGRCLLLADIDGESLDRAARVLSTLGFDVQTREVDISDPGSARSLAESVPGRLATLVHTAGISPSMADSARIYAVDLVGTANILDAFLEKATSDTVAVVIASMAAERASLDPALEQRLALAPAAALIGLVEDLPQSADPRGAYSVAKRGNQLRVEAAAIEWGKKGARVISLSPGIISTPMGALELEQPFVADLLRTSPVARPGTPEEIAAAVAWVAGPEARFVTGMDLRIDGGSTAAQRWGTATRPR